MKSDVMSVDLGWKPDATGRTAIAYRSQGQVSVLPIEEGFILSGGEKLYP